MTEVRSPGAPAVSAALHRQRHSAAHLLAEAVLEAFPSARIGIGPPIDTGFYYDFDLPRSLGPEDLEKIEARVRELVVAGGGFDYRVLDAAAAREAFADQPYKLELIDGIVGRGTDEYGGALAEEPVISTYRHGAFEDLCRGPHVADAGEIDPAGFKVSHVAGAYWRGDERRPMLQRVYALLFPSAGELEDHLARAEEARRRDHRRIGEEMDLFAFSAEVGRGLPLWLPRGTVVRDELEGWARSVEREWGYQRITTPHLTRGELYHISGHLPYYEEDLYAPIDIEGDEYYLRPMNCPHHHMVYKARPHSYRELPLRYAEYGTVYRYERSGQLFGLMRTRGFTQNDAHIYCTMDQAGDEFVDVMRLHDHYYRALGIEDFHMVLAVRDPANVAKYHGDAAMWDEAERITREAMDASGIDYVVDVGGAAHYGPKVDFVIPSVSGREFAASTNQLDLYMPGRFGLTYRGADGNEAPVAVIHRAPLGSSERFVAYLIEHFAGLFPVWLAPEQVRLVPITDAQVDYASSLAGQLFAEGFRVHVDRSDNRMQAKIRDAVAGRVPFVLVIGRKEVEAGTVSVRSRAGDEGPAPWEQFRDRLRALVATKSLEGAGHLLPGRPAA
ncbi:MAG: threonine--tRNA ligase [Acidimicrobiales bacterium]